MVYSPLYCTALFHAAFTYRVYLSEFITFSLSVLYYYSLSLLVVTILFLKKLNTPDQLQNRSTTRFYRLTKSPQLTLINKDNAYPLLGFSFLGFLLAEFDKLLSFHFATTSLYTLSLVFLFQEFKNLPEP